MYRDMMKGAPVESDHVLGDLLVRRQDVAAPLLRAAYVQLSVYMATRERGA
jgi:2-dehydropantoate 2-reductase